VHALPQCEQALQALENLCAFVDQKQDNVRMASGRRPLSWLKQGHTSEPGSELRALQAGVQMLAAELQPQGVRGVVLRSAAGDAQKAEAARVALEASLDSVRVSELEAGIWACATLAWARSRLQLQLQAAVNTCEGVKWMEAALEGYLHQQASSYVGKCVIRVSDTCYLLPNQGATVCQCDTVDVVIAALSWIRPYITLCAVRSMT